VATSAQYPAVPPSRPASRFSGYWMSMIPPNGCTYQMGPTTATVPIVVPLTSAVATAAGRDWSPSFAGVCGVPDPGSAPATPCSSTAIPAPGAAAPSEKPNWAITSDRVFCFRHHGIVVPVVPVVPLVATTYSRDAPTGPSRSPRRRGLHGLPGRHVEPNKPLRQRGDLHMGAHRAARHDARGVLPLPDADHRGHRPVPGGDVAVDRLGRH